MSMLEAQRPVSEPEVWQLAPRDPAREAAWMLELAAQGIHVAAHASEQPRGIAASLEPTSGDPLLVAVYPEGDPEPFWVDRRTMRLTHTPVTAVSPEHDVVRAADLADRAQLVIGEPVLVRYGMAHGRLAVQAVRRLEARIQFTNASYRKTAPLMADPGTLAPLSIDALERALRLEGDRGEEPRVRRIFARAYRRIDEHHTPWALERGEARRAAQRTAKLARDVALALADARKFRSELAQSVALHDAVELVHLDRQDLIDALHERMALVTDALALLERGRLATLSLLPPLEALCGTLPREVFAGLAAPQRTLERRAVDTKLIALARRCLDAEGALLVPPNHDPELSAEWTRLKRTLRSVRILGMDVRPDAMGSDDTHLMHGMQEAWALERDAPEAVRRRSERKVLQLAAKGPLGPLGVGPAAVLVGLLGRLAKAKGSVAEGLSAALLRLRAAALDAGRRLSIEGILERSEDALYMPLDEIEQALEGELGAYAARVRLRREDDRRWRQFPAPPRIVGRKP